MYLGVKIIVIDNNSENSDRLVLSDKIPSEDLIFNDENLGYGGGNNVGIKLGKVQEEGREGYFMLQQQSTSMNWLYTRETQKMRSMSFITQKEQFY